MSVGELPEGLRAVLEKHMRRSSLVAHETRKVDLSRLRLGDGGIFVAGELRGNTLLGELVLTQCGISAVGARALAEVLAEDNTTLKLLRLSGNRDVGDEGAETIAQMLRKNTTLEKLSLGFCGVGDRGVRALGEGLKENAALKELYLGGNGIGDDGADALADALRWSESLELLDLSRCQLTDAGASSLLSALREGNSNLTFLSLGINDIETKAIMDSIQELVQENEAVQPASAERRARCLLFCCLQLAPTAHEHVVPSIGAVPVPVMQYAVEHAAELHVAERFAVGDIVVRESSARVRDRSTLRFPIGMLEDGADHLDKPRSSPAL